MSFICQRSDFEGLPKAQCLSVLKQSHYLKEVKKIILELREDPDYSLLNNFIGKLTIKKRESFEQIVERVTKYIYSDWKMSADTTYNSTSKKDNILPDTTLKTHRAHCVGLSTLYLLAFEKLGVQANLIRIPRHALVQVCSGTRCLFIETLKAGKVVSRNFYFKNNYVSEKEVKGTFYFKKAKLLSTLYLSLGLVANGAKQFSLAELLYKKSIDADRRFADGYSNLAGVYQKQGRSRMASSYIDIALKINPVHLNSLINKALMLWNQKGKKAKKEVLLLLQKAQQINTGYIETYRIRSLLLEKLGRFKKAFINQLFVSLSRSKDCVEVGRLFTLKKKILSRVFIEKYSADLKMLRNRCEI